MVCIFGLLPGERAPSMAVLPNSGSGPGISPNPEHSLRCPAEDNGLEVRSRGGSRDA